MTATPATPSTTAATARAVAVFLGLFTLSRCLFAALGITFCTEHVAAFMHFPEPDLLRDRLVETLWHLHGQPPLPSLVLGVCLQLGGDRWADVLAAVLHGAVALGGASMVVVVIRCGGARWLAVALAMLWSLLPAVLVYEHYAFTTMPVAALLLLACVPLANTVSTGSGRAGFTFLLVLAAVVWTRNVFHLVWWLAAALLVWRAVRWPWRQALRVAALPLLVTVLPFAKNAIVHGTFASSTWMGFGLARKMWHALPPEERAQRLQTGELPPIAAVPVFGGAAEFAAVVGMPEATGVPLLDRPTKATGHPNYHHAVYVRANAALRAAALRQVLAHPDEYCASVAATFAQCWFAANSWGPVATPRAQLGAYAIVGDFLLHAPLPFVGVSAWSVLAAFAAVAAGLAAWRSWRRRQQGTAPSPRDVVTLFAVGTAIYVVVVAALLDSNEVMRLRLKIDGLLVVAVGLLAGAAVTPPQHHDVPRASPGVMKRTDDIP